MGVAGFKNGAWTEGGEAFLVFKAAVFLGGRAGRNKVRIFKHYVPLALLFLFLFESGVIVSSVFFSQYYLALVHGISVYDKHSYILILTTLSVSFYIGNLYDLKSLLRKREIFAKVFICHIASYIMVASVNLLIPSLYIHRYILFISLFVSLIAIVICRIIYSWLLNIEKLREKVLIIGETNIARKISEVLQTDSYLGYRVLGCLTEGFVQAERGKSDPRVLGDISILRSVVTETSPDVVVIALSEWRGAFPAQEILACKLRGVRVEDWPTFYEKVTGKILIQGLRPSWLIFSDGFTRNHLAQSLKRLIDALLAIVGLCLSLPLVTCIFLFTKLDSKGPVIFRQERVGENGKVFSLCKFRTMIVDAEKDSGPVWSQTVDPRVTHLGKILRRTGMDEIPQLFNVFKGDMSFVGPRPERPHFVAELQRYIPYYAQRLAVKPGITGWAQVRYGYGSTMSDAIEKLQYDLYYIKNMSLFLDFLIILSTIHKVLFAQVAVQSETDIGDNAQVTPKAYSFEGLGNDLCVEETTVQTVIEG